MTRNQLDAQVAANCDCTASYVTAIRLNPDSYKSHLADSVKAELNRTSTLYREFKREIKNVAVKPAQIACWPHGCRDRNCIDAHRARLSI